MDTVSESIKNSDSKKETIHIDYSTNVQYNILITSQLIWIYTAFKRAYRVLKNDICILKSEYDQEIPKYTADQPMALWRRATEH